VSWPRNDTPFFTARISTGEHRLAPSVSPGDGYYYYDCSLGGQSLYLPHVTYSSCVVWTSEPLRPREGKHGLPVYPLRAIRRSEQSRQASIQAALAMKGVISQPKHVLVQTAEQHRAKRSPRNECRRCARPEPSLTLIYARFHSEPTLARMGAKSSEMW
jgi:hypothetical protein